MQLFPFSPMGVEDMLTQLYALPDATLSIEATAIKSDFKQWIKEHFNLTENQVGFLGAINQDVSLYYGEQCSFCFLHRLDIKLVSPLPPETSGFAKWLASDNTTIAVKTNGTGGSLISGMLSFTISYK